MVAVGIHYKAFHFLVGANVDGAVEHGDIVVDLSQHILHYRITPIQIPLKAGWIAGAAIIQEHIGFPISKAAMR